MKIRAETMDDWFYCPETFEDTEKTSFEDDVDCYFGRNNKNILASEISVTVYV